MAYNKNIRGFVLYYVVIIGMILIMLAATVSRTIESNRFYSLYSNSVTNSENFIRNKVNTIFIMDTNVNTNGSPQDILSCSGWVITCPTWSGALCSTNLWVPISDGIDDSCDNDDYQGTYSSGNVSNLLSPDSKMSDDDDIVRRRATWFIAWDYIDQAFVMNTLTKWNITANKNNTGPALLPDTVDGITLDGIFSATGMSVTLYVLDKNAYDSSKIVRIVNTYTGDVLTYSWVLNSSGNFESGGSTPMVLNIRLYDYVLFLTNPSVTGAISYDIGAVAGGKPVYIVPLNDSVTPKTLFVPDYRMYEDELIYRSSVVTE